VFLGPTLAPYLCAWLSIGSTDEGRDIFTPVKLGCFKAAAEVGLLGIWGGLGSHHFILPTAMCNLNIGEIIEKEVSSNTIKVLLFKVK
jgi:hypothetical protein